MKKGWILFLAAVLMLSAMLPCAAKTFEDTTEYGCETAVEVLHALGIVNGKEDGVYEPSGSLTRAEMTAIVLRSMNVPGDSSASPSFSDVTKEHWAYGEIMAAQKMGIINGTGADTFTPDAAVTGEQAVKMVVSALGYGVQAEAQGGYPTGYLSKATALDLLNGITIDGDMTRGDMAILMYNALDTEVSFKSSYGADSYTFETNEAKTLLSYYLKVEHFTDSISATPMLSYRTLSMRPERKLLSDEVAVGSRVFKTGSTNAQNLFGVKSDIYARTEGDSETPVILAIVPRATTEVTNVKVQSIDKGQTTTGLLVFTDNAGKDQKIDISDAKFFYNGYEETKTPELLIPTNGTVRLISEKGMCEYVIVESFTNFIVDSKNDAENIIYLKGKSLPIDLEEFPTVFTDEFDEPLTIIDVAKDDILSVAESLGTDKVRRVYRSYASVKGTITEKSDEEVRIGEAIFPLALPLVDGEIDLGLNATFRLDFTGAVAAVDASKTAGTQYGWLSSAAMSKGLSGVPQIRLFTGDAAWKVFTLAEYVRFNDSTVKSDTLLLPGAVQGTALWTGGTTPPLFDKEGAIVPQLVRFKVNDAGQITELNTAINHSDPMLLEKTKYADNCFSMDWYWNADKSSYAGNLAEFNATPTGNMDKKVSAYLENVNGIFLGNVFADTETKVFIIPADLTYEKGYSVQSMQQFDMDVVRSTDYGALYDIDAAHHCGAIVVHNYLSKDHESGGAGTIDSYPNHEVANALVTGVSKTINEDGEIQHTLNLYNQNGQPLAVTCEEDFRIYYKAANANINADKDWYTVNGDDERLERSGEVTDRPAKMYIDAGDLCPGDVIKYKKDAVGNLTMGSVCFRCEYPGNVEIIAGSTGNIIATNPYLNYFGGSLLMNGTVEEISKYGPMVRVNLATEGTGMPTGKTALRALLSDGQFIVWDIEKQTMKTIARNEIVQGDLIFSVWATVQQRITIIYR